MTDGARIGLELIVLFGVSAAISAGLLHALRPLLKRYALARPNARSSHRAPTPQGGGIAVIAATVIVTIAAAFYAPQVFRAPQHLAITLACAIALAALGATDDIRPQSPLLRLIAQAVVVLVLVSILPAASLVPWLPVVVERALMVVAMLWFVNLFNFMDGIDWIAVAETVPLSLALVLLGLLGVMPGDVSLIALALSGAMVGFAPYNKPVARLFLGDVGSLPIGLLLAWMLALLAVRGHPAAALLLPLYYLADATITLLRRLIKREPLLEAHRGHFYQRALDGGMTVYAIVGHIFVLNIVLAGLALATVVSSAPAVHVAALAAGCLLVGLTLYRFGRKA